jgi:dihydroxyacetone kinase-like predicted kinase
LRALVAAREAGSEAFGYEVQFLLEADEAALPRLRAGLEPLGDSLVVVGGAGTWNVHVHVNDVGAALERGVEAGRPYRVTVTRFAEQAAVGADVPAQRDGRAVVAVVEGDGLTDLLRAEGAYVIPGVPQPSVGDLLAAVEACGAGEVVILPGDGELLATAQQAAAAARASDPGRTVVVVPTYSPVQDLAAIAVAQDDRPFGDDVVAMAEASGRSPSRAPRR